MKTEGELLTTKQLARMLKRHPNYVYAMRALGFPMPGGTATVDEAREWLRKHPRPRSVKHGGSR